MPKKKRKRNASSGSSSKRQCFYLVQDEQVLESGTKRKVEDLEASYRQLGMNVAVMDEQQYGSWKRHCITSKQDEEYREALRRDAEKQAEKQRLEQLQRDFSDREKRCEIIRKSYERLFQK